VQKGAEGGGREAPPLLLVASEGNLGQGPPPPFAHRPGGGGRALSLLSAAAEATTGLPKSKGLFQVEGALGPLLAAAAAAAASVPFQMDWANAVDGGCFGQAPAGRALSSASTPLTMSDTTLASGPRCCWLPAA